MLLEFDLAGAEWVVVAYLSGDANMMDVVQFGHSPHVATGKLISRAPEELVLRDHELIGGITEPDAILMLRKAKLPELLDGDYWVPRSMSIRQAAKKANHGLNYDMRYKRFALLNEMTEADARIIVALYREVAYPGLVRWHEEIRQELKTNDRTLTNLLGRRVRLLDQSGPDLWDAAYSFKPQSTVADIVLGAMAAAYQDRSNLFEHMRLKANVHDSVLVWYPTKPEWRLIEFARGMVKYLSPKLLSKGRSFTLGVDVKCGPNWGAMEKPAWALKAEDLPKKGDGAGGPLVHAIEAESTHLSGAHVPPSE